LFNRRSEHEEYEIVEEIKMDDDASSLSSLKKTPKLSKQKMVEMFNISDLISHFEKKFNFDL